MEKSCKIALLISDSHLWGLWLYKALKKENFLFEPILSSEIDESFPFKYRALFVPGGWSKNKLESLASWQKNIIKEFVREGGLYFGICGGASLAGEEGLSLVKIGRKKERVPSYSGPCIVDFNANPLFQGIKKPIFFLWFPPELEIKDPTLKILAKFKEPSPEAYTSDLCLEDHFPYLSQYEKIYGIPLSPDKMKNKPLLIEGTLEKGKILLSLIHFDTPFCKNSTLFWKNLAKFFNLPCNSFLKHEKQKLNIPFLSSLQRKFSTICKTLYKDTERLLNFAKRNFLFHQRYSFFYQWKRGIRGLEVLNLYFMLKEILECLRKNQYT
ncbi:MAG: BPL-N domain-containing protein, partial [Caldimicrobium sp.]